MSDNGQSPKACSSGLRERLQGICLALPEVAVEGDQHLIFKVRRKTFAYYLEDHHGDGEIAAVCKAAPGMNAAMVNVDPERFFMPAYVGPRGWVAVRLDAPVVDWDEIADLVTESYSMIAPRSLVRQIPKPAE